MAGGTRDVDACGRQVWEVTLFDWAFDLECSLHKDLQAPESDESVAWVAGDGGRERGLKGSSVTGEMHKALRRLCN